jgi:1,4-alpha-glucan branching enzyme
LAEAGLWQSDFDTDGFQWIDALDNQNSVLSFLRRDSERVSELAVILNLTPVPRLRYRLGLPRPGKWLEVLNSDAAVYGGSNMGNMGSVISEDIDSHNQSYSAEFVLPPLSIIAFRPERPAPEAAPEPAVAVSETSPQIEQSIGPAMIPEAGSL